MKNSNRCDEILAYYGNDSGTVWVGLDWEYNLAEPWSENANEQLWMLGTGTEKDIPAHL